MNLDDIKNCNRFEVMERIKGWNDIPDNEIDTVISILKEREIGIPPNVYIQKNQYLAKVYGYGFRGFFIGTQQLKYCVILWLPLLILIPPISVILFGLLIPTPYHLLPAFGLYLTTTTASIFSFYKCWYNSESKFLKLFVILICIMSVFNTLKFAVAFYFIQ